VGLALAPSIFLALFLMVHVRLHIDVRVLFKIAPLRVATMESTMPDFSASTCSSVRYRGGMRQRWPFIRLRANHPCASTGRSGRNGTVRRLKPSAALRLLANSSGLIASKVGYQQNSFCPV